MLDEKNKNVMFYGMILFADKISNKKLQIVSENVLVINFLEQIAYELYGVHFMLSENANAFIATLEGESYEKICTAYHMDPTAVQLHFDEDIVDTMDKAASFIKGAFLVAGAVSSPYSTYHLELVTHYYQLSKEITAFLQKINFNFKVVVRKQHYVMYLKDSTVMERFLYVLGAQNAAFDLVNAKIYKQIQNDNNRLNNCMGHNHEKTIDKAVKQVLAIQKIVKSKGLEFLPTDLREVALLRLQNRCASLSELCRLSDGKYSKAGLSRRLNKIIEIADKINGN